jgi:hypothetical protein
MFLNVIAIFKYIFIFWMKNYGSLQDDFCNLFLSLWTLGFSLTLNIARLADPLPSDIYANFSHVNPANEKNIEYNKTTQVEDFQNSGSQKSSSSFTNSGCLFNQHLQNLFAKYFEKVTLADFVTNFIRVLWIGLLSFI